jgi:uncharacterized phage infection (PIP) family protein YhgE
MNAAVAMPLIAFDTLAFANKLKAVGMDPKIAEAQAELQADVLNELSIGQLATKKDVQELKTDMRELRTELKTDMQELRTELKSDMQELRTELKTDMQELRTELKTEMQELRTDMHELRAEVKSDIHELSTGLKSDMHELSTELKSDMHELKFTLLVKFGAIVVGAIAASTAILGSLIAIFSRVH